MYEITLYDLTGRLQDARQVQVVVYDFGGVKCRSTKAANAYELDLFFPYHRIFEIKRVG